MIAKLEKEPKEDAAEKAYCDEETAKIEARAYLEMGLGGVQKTLEVLHEYYGRPSVLLCNNQQSLPCISAGGSIIGILEVCESDSSKNLAAKAESRKISLSTDVSNMPCGTNSAILIS